MNTNLDTIRVEPLPPGDPEATKDFLHLQREVSIDTYAGMPCLTQDNEPSHITEEDLAAFFDPNDSQTVEYLAKMAETNFDPVRKLGSVLLRAVGLGQGRRTIGTLNLKFGAPATLDNPASAILHDIAVHRDLHGCGVGSLLLGAALTTIRPRHAAGDVLNLMVVRTNQRAKAWYDKLGIDPTGHIKTSTWGMRDVKVELEERAASIDTLIEKIAPRRA